MFVVITSKGIIFHVFLGITRLTKQKELLVNTLVPASNPYAYSIFINSEFGMILFRFSFCIYINLTYTRFTEYIRPQLRNCLNIMKVGNVAYETQYKYEKRKPNIQPTINGNSEMGLTTGTSAVRLNNNFLRF